MEQIGYKEYQYLYETHLHTNQGSACASNTGAEMAKAAKEYGYTGIIVTEHNWGGNTCVAQDLPWEDWMDSFVKGYESAKKYGDSHDLDVFWGYEAGFDGTEFLIYGVSPEWMKSHPEINVASIEEQYHLIHDAGGFVVHAHPYREEAYIPEIRLYPRLVDAVEGVNATHSNRKSKHHNNPVFDERAIRYANKHQLPLAAGSDVHTVDMLGGGILVKHRFRSISDYKKVILSGDYLLTNGEVVYDCRGNILKIY